MKKAILLITLLVSIQINAQSKSEINKMKSFVNKVLQSTTNLLNDNTLEKTKQNQLKFISFDKNTAIIISVTTPSNDNYFADAPATLSLFIFKKQKNGKWEIEKQYIKFDTLNGNIDNIEIQPINKGKKFLIFIENNLSKMMTQSKYLNIYYYDSENVKKISDEIELNYTEGQTDSLFSTSSKYFIIENGMSNNVWDDKFINNAMPIILIFSESQSYDEKKKKKVSYDTHIYSYKKDKYIEYKK